MASEIRKAGAMSSTLADNIDALRERTERDDAATPTADQVARAITAFTGSMPFVYLHLVLVVGWTVWNMLLAAKPFDPQLIYLASIASVEAIFLSTFVLISQNRNAELDRRRDDLELHITLLTEHELTKLADLIARIAEKVGVTEEDPDFHEIRKTVEPEQVLDALREDEDRSR